MRINLDLTEPEYMRFKRKYPVLKDKEGYYFETQKPYLGLGVGLCIGLPDELDAYVINDDNE